jgi:hypothetical protein
MSNWQGPKRPVLAILPDLPKKQAITDPKPPFAARKPSLARQLPIPTTARQS